MDSNRYDIVIIGSGLGGLMCGAILSREGYNVCVLERHTLFGGCLQSFQRGGVNFDTGMHYVGSMDRGKILYQYLKFVGVADRLDMIKLDPTFDVLHFGDEECYNYVTGYEAFQESLIERFPDDKDGIKSYLSKIRSIGSSIDVDTHLSGHLTRGALDNLSISAAQYIDSCVDDPTLRGVLAGTNVLYGGVRESSNLYHHAMINHSNIEGAYRFVGGSQQLADLLVAQIRENGGRVESKCEVCSIDVNDASVKSVTLKDGRKIFAKSFISNLHPMSTFNMVGATPLVKKAYRSRLALLPNTYGLFSVYLKMKSGSFAYINKNHYIYHNRDVWSSVMNDDLKPKSIVLSAQLSSAGAKYSDAVILMSPISSSLFESWVDTTLSSRDEQYRELKRRISEQIVDFTSAHFPNFKENIESVYTSTPLTFKHYTGTPQGSAYGILKDYRNSMATLMSTSTRITNLYLTGQNINVHGALGVVLTAATTCAQFIGEEYLAKKVGGA